MNIWGSRTLSGVVAAAALASVPLASLQAQVVGIAAAVRNQVQISKVKASKPRAAQRGQQVALRNEVRTADQSHLQLLLLDRSTFTVGANARVTIDRFVYDPDRGVRSVAATVSRGAFRFMSGRLVKSLPGGSSIRTPIVSIGIRGTIVEGVVGRQAIRIAAGEPAVGRKVGGDPDTASLIILRGPGPNPQGNASPGAIDVQAGKAGFTLDRPMLALYVPAAGRAPIGPFTISGAGIRAMQALLSPPPPPLVSGPTQTASAGPGGTTVQQGAGGAQAEGVPGRDVAPDGFRPLARGGSLPAPAYFAALAAAMGGLVFLLDNKAKPVSP